MFGGEHKGQAVGEEFGVLLERWHGAIIRAWIRNAAIPASLEVEVIVVGFQGRTLVR